ncbi:NAD-dependent epimerase/dehydratase family protein [Synechococcus sp. CBW1107]|uniref:NAD-dependent epimerase/dehydratase family protein n=1 Tax=Synechococcus sp. CBW1107 TaxID=2789857 RepID=UPI002AD585B1|nr:NAD-dependent epimerase/dehydratase family protein [Synechococcus sp. CBW1107]CAK6687533.1 hypothetical protein MNNICLKF_00236 [Synechococcus sp. CBW1107]
MNRIAITGASGFIGRYFTQYLVERDFDVVPLSRSVPIEFAPDRFTLQVDYSNISELVQVFCSCDVVVHLAAIAHQYPSRSSPIGIDTYRKANIDCLMSVVRACKLANVSRLVFVSSIGVNGSSTFGRAFTESDEPSPKDFYSITKLEAEQALASEVNDTQIDWVVLRPPLVYGPFCPGNLNRLLKLTSVLPLLPFRLLRSRRTLISILNLSEALFVSCYHPGVSRRVFLISDSVDIDVSGILKAFLLGLGRGQWRLLPIPPSFIAPFFTILGKKALWNKFSGELLVDSSLFRKVTGWVPLERPTSALIVAASSMNK